jgi:uncharacterized protein involved in type VI secretion and phage assembly
MMIMVPIINENKKMSGMKLPSDEDTIGADISHQNFSQCVKKKRAIRTSIYNRQRYDFLTMSTSSIDDTITVTVYEWHDTPSTIPDRQQQKNSRMDRMKEFIPTFL